MAEAGSPEHHCHHSQDHALIDAWPMELRMGFLCPACRRRMQRGWGCPHCWEAGAERESKHCGLGRVPLVLQPVITLSHQRWLQSAPGTSCLCKVGMAPAA